MQSIRPFLTAHWREVLMLNYQVDPAILHSFLPAGLSLDLWQGCALVSVVGFRFLKTKVLGLPIPFHRNFEEVNLRFYVRLDGGKMAALKASPAVAATAASPTIPVSNPPSPDARRGVVFVKEIVPKPWVARMARLLFRENYIATRMGHTIERDKQGKLRRNGLVEYTWRTQGRINRLGGLALGDPLPLAPGSEEEFIAEHYWGYTRLDARRTAEYPVAHAPWRVYQVAQPYLLCDVKSLYGEAFVPFLKHRPRSAFLAEGSEVVVGWGRKI